ncbi:MAG: DUF2877 domain-containing protein [Armatimonadota bacterium]|nr:DUF2877 domain-containing protein [Armatimonadota bacterium]
MGRARGGTVTHAVCIPAPLTGLLEGAAQGTVLAVFERGAYVDLAGHILALTSAAAGRGPLTVVLSDPVAIAPVGVGDPVRLEDRVLWVGPHAVAVAGADGWDPALPQPSAPSPAGSARALEQVAEELRGSASPDSLVGLLDLAARPVREGPWQWAAADRLAPIRGGLEVIGRFLAGFASVEDVTRAVASGVAGRGPGLTPSGDDLLTGVMHAITVWPHIAAPADGVRAREVLAAAALGRTTRISAAYLQAAAEGLAAEPWHGLVRSLDRSASAVKAAVRRILAVGHTSGADALTGFCWGWYLATRRAPS